MFVFTNHFIGLSSLSAAADSDDRSRTSLQAIVAGIFLLGNHRKTVLHFALGVIKCLGSHKIQLVFLLAPHGFVQERPCFHENCTVKMRKKFLGHLEISYVAWKVPNSMEVMGKSSRNGVIYFPWPRID